MSEEIPIALVKTPDEATIRQYMGKGHPYDFGFQPRLYFLMSQRIQSPVFGDAKQPARRILRNPSEAPGFKRFYKSRLGDVFCQINVARSEEADEYRDQLCRFATEEVVYEVVGVRVHEE